MIAGSLQVKNGYYYMVLCLPVKNDGKKATKWIATGLKVKGNKKRAEEMLINARREYDPEETQKRNPHRFSLILC